MEVEGDIVLHKRHLPEAAVGVVVMEIPHKVEEQVMLVVIHPLRAMLAEIKLVVVITGVEAVVVAPVLLVLMAVLMLVVMVVMAKVAVLQVPQ